MHTDFRIFSLAHFAIMAAIPCVAAAMAWLVRGNPTAARRTRLSFGVFLLVNELIWYGYKLANEGSRFPEGLPLQLCDLSLWLSVFSLLALRRWTFEPGYFVGIAGASMAVVTPELWAPAWSYPTAYFFVAHGGIIAAMLFLVWSGQARPSRHAMWRGFLVLNVWAAFVGTFNAVFHTNYMFLCRKPVSASALDAMGAWPWYLVGGEAAALLLFALLALPFRKPAAV